MGMQDSNAARPEQSARQVEIQLDFQEKAICELEALAEQLRARLDAVIFVNDKPSSLVEMPLPDVCIFASNIRNLNQRINGVNLRLQFILDMLQI